MTNPSAFPAGILEFMMCSFSEFVNGGFCEKSGRRVKFREESGKADLAHFHRADVAYAVQLTKAASSSYMHWA
jgi:hypothetical protein